MSELRAIAEQHLTVPDHVVSRAGEVIEITSRLATGRQNITMADYFPSDLADASALISRPLPTDDLSVIGTLTCGYSGVQKLGNKIAISHDHSVPTNIWWINCAPTGVSKTAVKQKLIDAPAAGLRLKCKTMHADAVDEWRANNKGVKKDDRPPAPKPWFVHLSDYTPEALCIQLEVQLIRRMALLASRDEWSGNLKALESDSKIGRGTGVAQMLEMFDGSASSAVRVDGGVRQFEECLVSFYGNIQPEKLREHINGQDVVGQFARFQFNQLPLKPLELSYLDPSDEERQAYNKAKAMLASYAEELHDMPELITEVTQDARKHLHDWFRPQQELALLPTTPQVVKALLGKSSAHAQRWAGMLHRINNLKTGNVDSKLTLETMMRATRLVDQINGETRQFHKGPPTPTQTLMQMAHQWSWNKGHPRKISWQIAKKELCTTDALREVGADGFNKMVADLVERGWGGATKGRAPAYTAERVMP